MGYRLAGFRVIVQAECEEDRAAVGQANFLDSTWIVDDVCRSHDQIVKAYRNRTKARLALLVATPPCQGMSSSNPSRGKRSTPKAALQESKNRLLLEIVPIALALKPRVIVCENVRQILTLHVCAGGLDVRLIDGLRTGLPEYEFYETVIDVADYGIPQHRLRAVVVGVHQNEPWLVKMRERGRVPWPKRTHGQTGQKRRLWITLRQWFRAMRYPSLSAQSPELAKNGHPLHFVPHYDAHRFGLLEDIPAHSAQSAYQNKTCRACGFRTVPDGMAVCPQCHEPMWNRPIVKNRKGARLIKGFASSYRRMRSDEPAPTVTTNSSHVGSDNKIHPWEPRVLSVLEAADLQTVPRFYDWSPALDARKSYLVRNVIGEALPTYFTYLHGCILARLLRGDDSVLSRLEQRAEDRA